MRIGFAIILSAACFGCKSTRGGQSTLNETEVRNFEDELGMKPGIGFNGIIEDVRETCVEHDGLETAGTAQEVVYDIKMVERHGQLMGNLGVSSASLVKTALVDKDIQASRKTKFAMGSSFSVNQYSVYLLVSARIANQTATLKNPRVMEAIKQNLAADPEKNLQAFRDQCGDSYLKGYTSGGEYQALIEISTNTDQMTASLKKNYNQSLDGGAQTSDRGQFEASLNAMTASQNVTIRTFQSGGQGAAEVGMVKSIPEMMDRIRKLADYAKLGQNPRPLTATFTDYFTLGLPLPQAYKTSLQNAKDFIDELAEIEVRLLDLSGNVSYITSKPESFVGVNAAKLAELQNARAAIDAAMKKIRDKGRACSNSLAACTGAAEVTVPTVTLPKRKQTLESLSKNVLRIKTKLNYVNVEAIRDGWFNPPECYLAVTVGGNGDKNFTTVRRTPTTFGNNRCSNLADNITIPMSVVKDVLTARGVALDKGWISLQAWEDDPSYDDFLGEAYVYLRDLQNGAQLKGLNNANLNIDVGFEIEE